MQTPTPTTSSFCVRLNSSVKDSVLDSLTANGISHASDLRTALPDVFRTLQDSNETTNCSRFIVIIFGSDNACISSCSASSSAPLTCLRNLLCYVEQEQRRFKDGNRTTLVTFTERVANINAGTEGAEAVVQLILVSGGPTVTVVLHR